MADEKDVAQDTAGELYARKLFGESQQQLMFGKSGPEFESIQSRTESEYALRGDPEEKDKIGLNSEPESLFVQPAETASVHPETVFGNCSPFQQQQQANNYFPLQPFDPADFMSPFGNYIPSGSYGFEDYANQILGPTVASQYAGESQLSLTAKFSETNQLDELAPTGMRSKSKNRLLEKEEDEIPEISHGQACLSSGPPLTEPGKIEDANEKNAQKLNISGNEWESIMHSEEKSKFFFTGSNLAEGARKQEDGSLSEKQAEPELFGDEDIQKQALYYELLQTETAHGKVQEYSEEPDENTQLHGNELETISEVLMKKASKPELLNQKRKMDSGAVPEQELLSTGKNQKGAAKRRNMAVNNAPIPKSPKTVETAAVHAKIKDTVRSPIFIRPPSNDLKKENKGVSEPKLPKGTVTTARKITATGCLSTKQTQISPTVTNKKPSPKRTVWSPTTTKKTAVLKEQNIRETGQSAQKSTQSRPGAETPKTTTAMKPATAVLDSNQEKCKPGTTELMKQGLVGTKLDVKSRSTSRPKDLSPVSLENPHRYDTKDLEQGEIEMLQRQKKIGNIDLAPLVWMETIVPVYEQVWEIQETTSHIIGKLDTLLDKTTAPKKRSEENDEFLENLRNHRSETAGDILEPSANSAPVFPEEEILESVKEKIAGSLEEKIPKLTAGKGALEILDEKVPEKTENEAGGYLNEKILRLTESKTQEFLGEGIAESTRKETLDPSAYAVTETPIKKMPEPNRRKFSTSPEKEILMHIEEDSRNRENLTEKILESFGKGASGLLDVKIAEPVKKELPEPISQELTGRQYKETSERDRNEAPDVLVQKILECTGDILGSQDERTPKNAGVPDVLEQMILEPTDALGSQDEIILEIAGKKVLSLSVAEIPETTEKETLESREEKSSELAEEALGSIKQELTEAPEIERKEAPDVSDQKIPRITKDTLGLEDERIPEIARKEGPTFLNNKIAELGGNIPSPSNEKTPEAPGNTNEVVLKRTENETPRFLDGKISGYIGKEIPESAAHEVAETLDERAPELTGKEAAKSQEKRIPEHIGVEMAEYSSEKILENAGEAPDSLDKEFSELSGEIQQLKNEISEHAENEIIEFSDRQIKEITGNEASELLEEVVSELATKESPSFSDKQSPELTGEEMQESLIERTSGSFGYEVSRSLDEKVQKSTGEKAARSLDQKIMEPTEGISEPVENKMSNFLNKKISELTEKVAPELLGAEISVTEKETVEITNEKTPEPTGKDIFGLLEGEIPEPLKRESKKASDLIREEFAGSLEKEISEHAEEIAEFIVNETLGLTEEEVSEGADEMPELAQSKILGLLDKEISGYIEEMLEVVLSKTCEPSGEKILEPVGKETARNPDEETVEHAEEIREPIEVTSGLPEEKITGTAGNDGNEVPEFPKDLTKTIGKVVASPNEEISERTDEILDCLENETVRFSDEKVLEFARKEVLEFSGEKIAGPVEENEVTEEEIALEKNVRDESRKRELEVSSLLASSNSDAAEISVKIEFEISEKMELKAFGKAEEMLEPTGVQDMEESELFSSEDSAGITTETKPDKSSEVKKNPPETPRIEEGKGETTIGEKSRKTEENANEAEEKARPKDSEKLEMDANKEPEPVIAAITTLQAIQQARLQVQVTADESNAQQQNKQQQGQEDEQEQQQQQQKLDSKTETLAVSNQSQTGDEESRGKQRQKKGRWGGGMYSDMPEEYNYSGGGRGSRYQQRQPVDYSNYPQLGYGGFSGYQQPAGGTEPQGFHQQPQQPQGGVAGGGGGDYTQNYQSSQGHRKSRNKRNKKARNWQQQ